MICDAFFFTNSAKTPLYLHVTHLLDYFFSLLAIATTALLQFWWLSQVVGPGFEPGLVLERFCSSASRLCVRTSPSPYVFCNKRVAENIPVLSGRLVSDTYTLLFLSLILCVAAWISLRCRCCPRMIPVFVRFEEEQHARERG